uniref:Probable basic-leucine zipper transcription factor S n=1 Tax=Cicer arietinum TaxID=3827 RepID=A0A1S3EBH9_CICAR|nr:probable basic-leucine zipper transcription factor S [Cicer arietinum]
MASEKTISFHEDETMKPLYVEQGTAKNRGRRSNGKGPKKPPQRGLGVEQLERMRAQETLKKMAEASGIVHLDHHHQCHFGNSNNSVNPLRYNAQYSSNGSFHFPQQMMMNENNNNNNVFGAFIGNNKNHNVGAGWLVPNINQHNNKLETSKNLSSMSNINSQCFDLCLKKTRLNEENVIRGTNATRREMPLGMWSNMNDFLGFVPQHVSPNFVGENGDFYNKLVRHDATVVSAYPTHHNLDEVVAVHRRGNSSGSGRVFMEYEFFPGKDGRGTTSKELEFPTNTNTIVFGEPSSSITFTAYGGDTTTTASNSIDLSLKL